MDLWLDRPHGDVNGPIAQMLSGHGVFRAYLKRRGLSQTDRCVFCHEVDTVEHAVFFCRRFRWLRGRVELTLGETMLPDVIVPAMCGGEAKWTAVAAYLREVIAAKDREARFGEAGPT